MRDRYQPLITIAIPTYNRADAYLRQALESALSQSYQNIEIIVSDNCSVDNTEMLMGEYRDPRIKYIKHVRNIGANANFNFCLQEARGVYFLLLHDDDSIDNDFIEICMNTSKYATDIGLIRTGMRIIDNTGKVVYEIPNSVAGFKNDDFVIGWFSGKTPMHLCCTLFNTNLLRGIGGFKSRYELFQDVIAEMQLALRYGRVDIREIKASFRKHSSQNTFSKNVNEWCEDSLVLLNLICELVDERKDMVKAEGLRFFTHHNYNIARNIKSPLNRLKAYKIINRMFGNLPSYVISQKINRQVNKFKQLLKPYIISN